MSDQIALFRLPEFVLLDGKVRSSHHFQSGHAMVEVEDFFVFEMVE